MYFHLCYYRCRIQGQVNSDKSTGLLYQNSKYKYHVYYLSSKNWELEDLFGPAPALCWGGRLESYGRSDAISFWKTTKIKNKVFNKENTRNCHNIYFLYSLLYLLKSYLNYINFLWTNWILVAITSYSGFIQNETICWRYKKILNVLPKNKFEFMIHRLGIRVKHVLKIVHIRFPQVF